MSQVADSSKAAVRWPLSPAIQNTSREVHTDNMCIRIAISVPEWASDSRPTLENTCTTVIREIVRGFSTTLLYSLLDSQSRNRIKPNYSTIRLYTAIRGVFYLYYDSILLFCDIQTHIVALCARYSIYSLDLVRYWRSIQY